MHYDVIVIGAGQAGVPLATRFAGAGRRTLLIEKETVGGTCINRGCTPTKTMVASARAAHVARTAGRLGVRTGEVAVDFAAVIARKDAIVRQWREGLERRLAAAGDRLTVAAGAARFRGPRTLALNGDTHTADIVIINTGARPAIPPLPGLSDVPFLDSTAIMEMRELPRHLVVLGGGYIGCEFGQMFRRFGSAVTIVGRPAHLLDREDPELSEAVEAVFRREGVTLRLGAAAQSVRWDGTDLVVERDGAEPVRGSHLLVAVGRSPNTADLGCAAAGIALDSRGFITVDDGFRTSAAGVYAVGDVTGGPQFTHNSWDDHRVLFDIVAGTRDGGRAGRLVPYCVFTDPPLARVGLSEREARDRGVPFEVATLPFGHIARAVEVDEPDGLVKILLDPATERLLGAAIVGLEAGELIHVYAALMQAGAGARAIVDGQAVHPTLAEGLQSAVMRLPRFALS